MGLLDYLILAAVAGGILAAMRYLKKHGISCGGCNGDCVHCKRKK